MKTNDLRRLALLFGAGIEGVEPAHVLAALSPTTDRADESATDEDRSLLGLIDMLVSDLLESRRYEDGASAVDDLTEHFELPAALNASTELLRASERMSGIGSWELDQDAGIIAWSDGVYRLLDLRPGDPLAPDAYSQVVHPGDRVRVHAAIADAIASRSPVSIRHRIIRSDGTERVLALQAEPPADKNSRVKLIGTVRDITTEVADQERLQRAQQLDSIGRLAGGIAHDLNNLFTVLSGHAEMLSEIVTGRGRENVAAIRRATSSAAALTRQLLEVGRREILQPTVIDVNAMIESHRATCRRMLPAAVTLVIETADGLPAVLMDAGKLDQVVLNIVLNAADAVGASGSVLIETAFVNLSTEGCKGDTELRPGSYVCVNVTDDGAGIPPEVLPRVFDPFFTTKPPGRGTGLGLSTSYGIMQQSGGHLSLSSQVGVGTSVRIYVPATTDLPLPPMATIDESLVPRMPPGVNVLVVEDAQPVRDLTVAALEHAGCRVFAAVDGPNGVAVAAACTDRIDLLVTDVAMPGFGGHELATRLFATRPGLRVLYISGYTQDSVVLQGVTHSGINFLAKPFTVGELLAKVVEVLADQPVG